MMENTRRFLEKAKHRITIWSNNPTPGYISGKDKNFYLKRYIHLNGILLAHKKEWNNAICINVDGPRDYHTKWSNSDGERKYHMISHKHEILKTWYKWIYLQNRNRLKDIENKLMFTKKERWEGDKLGVWD